MTKKTAKKPVAKTWKDRLRISVIFPFIVTFFGFTGMAASVVINIEKEDLLLHPKTVLVCDLNPIYSCANVITSKQSKTLGISNELFGIAMFGGIAAVGMTLIAGAQPKKWFWQLFMGGMAAFTLTTVYLWYQSVYTIGSLCIFCSSVWFSGWAITTSLYAQTYDQLLYKKVPKELSSLLKWIRNNILLVWFCGILLLTLLTLKHFWYYYGPHFGF